MRKQDQLVTPEVKNLVQTRIPTQHGEFTLHYYSNNIDEKEHVAFVKGVVKGRRKVPVRIHSECFTGDVLGSRRCDCGEQLDMALRIISEVGYGVLVYMRQEGRGIGLLKKLQAYNLQDEGLDTVDANIHLGHLPDEREYTLAALMLKELGVDSIDLITNNPRKIDEMKRLGIEVEERIPIESNYHHDNVGYLRAKAERMSHLLSFSRQETVRLPTDIDFIRPFLRQLEECRGNLADRPFITLSYAQSADGSISAGTGTPYPLSGAESLMLTHVLRAHHDALLVGINTVLVDDPKLNVRLYQGSDPQPVVLDCLLRFPEDAQLLSVSSKTPIIFTTDQADEAKKRRLEARGLRIFTVGQTSRGRVDLAAALKILFDLNLKTLMVEGGGEVINEFLASGLADYCVITVAPKIIGGLKAVEQLCRPVLEISGCRYRELGRDLIVYGALKPDEA
ncbi:MAG: GTP cyclohydrolase II [Gammaproteobacteria bacterium]